MAQALPRFPKQPSQVLQADADEALLFMQAPPPFPRPRKVEAVVEQLAGKAEEFQTGCAYFSQNAHMK